MMEMWQGLSHEAILSMPSGRRRRFIQKKIDLEKKRAADAKVKK